MIYKIKRFSEEKKESHALRNTLLGVGAVAGGVMAGRAGWLGAGVQKGIGKATAQVGKWTNSSGLMRDGVKTFRKGSVTSGRNELISGSNGAIKSAKELGSENIKLVRQNAKIETENMMNKMGISSDIFKKPPVPNPTPAT